MRNPNFDDAIITLHNVARMVEDEIGVGKLSQSIRYNADWLHRCLIVDDKAAIMAQKIIDKAREE